MAANQRSKMLKQQKIPTMIAMIQAFGRRACQQAGRRLLPIRVIGILLALFTGAMFGMLLPVPPPPGPAADMHPAAAAAFVRTGQPPDGAGRGIPRPPTDRMEAEPIPAGDTLPAAPLRVRALDRPPPEEKPRERRHVIRIEDAERTQAAHPGRRRSSAKCPGAGDLAYDGPIICIRETHP